jgi:hypothetical protein
MENDTDTLLALLSSLLREPIPDQETLLDALIRSKGDVQDAAATITSNLSKKRKRAADLDDWLCKPNSALSAKPRSGRDHHDSETKPSGSSTRPRSSSVIPRPSVKLPVSISTKPVSSNALIALRSPPIEQTNKIPPQLPPLTLAHPDLIAQTVPCTMHPGVLPADLAYRLFEVMLDKAESWKRNRWWLFERAVESPHKSSFFVRDMKMISENISYSRESNEIELREAAHYW